MNIIIIGAGPSGMMCAIKVKNGNNNVTIIEKNDKAGKKLLLTGSGRCNYANEIINSDCYFTENSDLIENIINIVGGIEYEIDKKLIQEKIII